MAYGVRRTNKKKTINIILLVRNNTAQPLATMELTEKAMAQHKRGYGTQKFNGVLCGSIDKISTFTAIPIRFG